MKKMISVLLALVLSLGLCSAFAENAALPAYSWTGDDPVCAAVIKYMQDTDFGCYVPEGGVLIPTPIILKTDPAEVKEDTTEVTVYGNFWIFTYALKGKILETSSGCENPGILKLEKKDGVWTVASAEFAGLGDDYIADIKKFAGGDKELEEEYFRSTGSEDSYLPQFQRAAVVEYVNANGLDIEAFQDPGWDPVSVID